MVRIRRIRNENINESMLTSVSPYESENSSLFRLCCKAFLRLPLVAMFLWGALIFMGKNLAQSLRISKINATKLAGFSSPTDKTNDDGDHAKATDEVDYILRKYSALAPYFATSLNVSLRPTVSRPFFYFHFRNARGTSLLNAIDTAGAWAGESGMRRYIPCITFACQPSDVHPSKSTWNITGVYASHVNYVQAENVLEEVRQRRRMVNATESGTAYNDDKTRGPVNQDDSVGSVALPPLFSCMVNIRSTVERVVSCWNETGMPASERNVTLWDTLLPSSYSKDNKGCNNEWIRGFGTNYQNETAVNTMRIVNDRGKSNWDAVREIELIMSRLSTCVVVKIDQCEESWEILSHYLPWLGDLFQCNPSSTKHNEMNKGGKSTPSAYEVAGTILRHNAIDEYIYRFADELFRQQLIVARDALRRVAVKKRQTRLHPNAGARDENGTWGYVANTACSRNHSKFEMDSSSMKEVCGKHPGKGLERGPGGYEMLSNWVQVRSDIPHSLNDERVEEDAPRILCLVYTHGTDKARSRVRAVIETWGHRCDGFIAASNETVPELGAVDLPHSGPEIYDNMWQKIRSILHYVYTNFIDQYEYFHICGDDTYIIVENLRYFLWNESGGRAEEGGTYPLYAGRWVRHPFPQERKPPGYYAIGGAGYTLNREALRRFVGHSSCGQYIRISSEDRMIGMCFGELGISANETRDDLGSQRYLGERPNDVYLFNPENHPNNYLVHQFRWYEEMGQKPRTGLEAVSREAVAFHRLKLPNEMRRVHAILYKLCPSGTVLGDAMPNGTAPSNRGIQVK